MTLLSSLNSLVRTLADFVEFDDALNTAARKGSLTPEKIEQGEDQLGRYSEKLARLAGYAQTDTHILEMNNLPWSDAFSEIEHRKAMRRRLIAYKARQKDELEEIRALFA